MAQDHCTSIEDENSGRIIVKGTSYRVENVPPLVFQLIGTDFFAPSRPFGTNSFLMRVLLQPVSISTRVNLFG